MKVWLIYNTMRNAYWSALHGNWVVDCGKQHTKEMCMIDDEAEAKKLMSSLSLGGRGSGTLQRLEVEIDDEEYTRVQSEFTDHVKQVKKTFTEDPDKVNEMDKKIGHKK